MRVKIIIFVSRYGYYGIGKNVLINFDNFTMNKYFVIYTKGDKY